MVTYICDDGEIADCFNDDEPPVDRVGLDRQDSLLQVDDFVFGGVKTNDTSNEHHRICEWKCRGEECCCCEDSDDGHVSLPGIVQLFSEHIGRHLILLFVKVVDAFEETIVKLSHLLVLSALKVIIDLEHHER